MGKGIMKCAQPRPHNAGEKISTPNRRITTAVPHPDDRKTTEVLRRCEPRSVAGQAQIVWDRAEGVHLFDRHGNQWLDFSSGVLVANAGHGSEAATAALAEVAQRPLHHSYCFPNAERAALVEYLVDRCAPAYLDKVLLLTTGSEAVECALKISRAHAHRLGGRQKDWIVSFTNAFHGRTMGSQMAGGIASLKEWIVHQDPCMINAPTPDPLAGKDATFDNFIGALADHDVDPKAVAAVLLETYQGGTAILLARQYVEELRNFCNENDALLIFDEVQAGFGRCGRMWGFEHYGVRADLIVCGKGISSGLPLSAVIGHSDWMNVFPEGSMTSTHTGNPVCCAAALENIRLIVEGGLIENARRLEPLLKQRVIDFTTAYPEKVANAAATGLIAALQIVSRRGSQEPDPGAASAIVNYAVEHGLMLLAPAGLSGSTLRVCPPLCITREQLCEGLDVFDQALAEVCG